MYQRLTKDIYVIQGYYDRAYGWEDVAGYENYQEAKKDLLEYRKAEKGYAHRLIKKRVHIDKKEG